jgi:hypothetical protein
MILRSRRIEAATRTRSDADDGAPATDEYGTPAGRLFSVADAARAEPGGRMLEISLDQEVPR